MAVVAPEPKPDPPVTKIPVAPEPVAMLPVLITRVLLFTPDKVASIPIAPLFASAISFVTDILASALVVPPL